MQEQMPHEVREQYSGLGLFASVWSKEAETSLKFADPADLSAWFENRNISVKCFIFRV
jgi:hypothetical protein